MARAELLWPWVEKTLLEILGDAVQAIDDHVVAVQHGSSRILIRLLDADEPQLQVFSPMLSGVDKTPELLDALNELNQRIPYAKVFWIERDVMLATELLASSLDKQSITNALGVVAKAADHFDDELKDRFGGETAFAQPQPSDAPEPPSTHADGVPEGVSLPPGMEQGDGPPVPKEGSPPPEDEAAAAKTDDGPNRDDVPGYL